MTQELGQIDSLVVRFAPYGAGALAIAALVFGFLSLGGGSTFFGLFLLLLGALGVVAAVVGFSLRRRLRDRGPAGRKV